MEEEAAKSSTDRDWLVMALAAVRQVVIRVLSATRRALVVALALARQDPGLAAILVMAVAGSGVSIYLTTIHYANVPALCTTGGVVNCASVLHSAYSNVPLTTIPISVAGLLWFLVSGGLATAGLMSIARNRLEPERLRPAQLLWSAAGLLFVLYLVYAEIVKLHSICEWCTSVHILTLITFLIALNRLQLAAAPASAPVKKVQSRPPRLHPAARAPSRLPATRQLNSKQVASRRPAGANGDRSHAQSRKR
jgi:uncharacterized membrane protein